MSSLDALLIVFTLKSLLTPSLVFLSAEAKAVLDETRRHLHLALYGRSPSESSIGVGNVISAATDYL